MRKSILLRFTTYGLFSLILTIVLSISTPVKTQTVSNPYNQPTANSFIYPAQGIVSQGFRKYQHEGIDIAGASGTPIYAAAAGKVIKAGWDDWGLGNAISIGHRDGRVTVYGHNRRVLVSKGQEVKQGQIVAEMGSTGNSSGPHLHFEIHTNKRVAVDPLIFLPSPTATVAIAPPRQQAPSPSTVVNNSKASNRCDGRTVIEGETNNAYVRVCQEKGNLFYIGQLKQNRNQAVKLPAWSISDSQYRADNGSFSYFITPQGVEIWRNGQRIRTEDFYTR